MNVPTIEMTEEEALAKLQAWLNEKHADAQAAREDCLKGYNALAEGKRLVHLDAAIRGGGFHASGFPKLAVARADREKVHFEWQSTVHLARFDTRAHYWHGPVHRGNPGTLIRTIEMLRTPNVSKRRGDGSTYFASLSGWAQVPLLPADVRPEKGLLKDWFILWEVEQWFADPDPVQPDRDPMLLEHVAGQLYAVRAEWDLTELERAVMAGALRPQA